MVFFLHIRSQPAALAALMASRQQGLAGLFGQAVPPANGRRVGFSTALYYRIHRCHLCLPGTGTRLTCALYSCSTQGGRPCGGNRSRLHKMCQPEQQTAGGLST